ncbi:hypothetical protein PGTUg99_008571 [Puccinia graminis f. sp. tritici]|nr:hypothetical protein PGTUg99_008571 [Puccinia graminis f. sp. tritici]
MQAACDIVPLTNDLTYNGLPITRCCSLATSDSTYIKQEQPASTWHEELKLTGVVEQEQNKLLMATASRCSTITSISSSNSRVPPALFGLPRPDDRLALLVDKLEIGQKCVLGSNSESNLSNCTSTRPQRRSALKLRRSCLVRPAQSERWGYSLCSPASPGWVHNTSISS